MFSPVLWGLSGSLTGVVCPSEEWMKNKKKKCLLLNPPQPRDVTTGRGLTVSFSSSVLSSAFCRRTFKTLTKDRLYRLPTRTQIISTLQIYEYSIQTLEHPRFPLNNIIFLHLILGRLKLNLSTLTVSVMLCCKPWCHLSHVGTPELLQFCRQHSGMCSFGNKPEMKWREITTHCEHICSAPISWVWIFTLYFT